MKKPAVFLSLLLALIALPVRAQTAAPIDTAARQAYLVDAGTGVELFSKEGDTRMAPSSMSKMVTIYLVFEAIKNGKLTLDQELPVSEHAWKQEGSRMFLNVGQKAKVEDLIRGVIVQSGNDAAVVFAETLGGSEQNFAEMMNSKAAELGLTGSHFVNATGLPDPEHYSTAHDLARVALALIRDFPEDYHYFSEPSFTYNNIPQGNRNPLLYRNMDVDGLKTGHTDEGGFGLTASALRGGRRLILVLNGMNNMQMRADESAKVLDWGYREFANYPVVKAGDKLAEAKVWLGQGASVPLMATQDVTLTLPRGARGGLKTSIDYTQPVQAPIAKGQPLGKLTISAPGMDDKVVPLVAAEDVDQLGFFARVAAKLRVLAGPRSDI
jgi:D-alanyl-D-alanine carboxypeptidase (penicillin-binding protein 5/6)